MGAAYRATQLRLDKPVAMKVMARELSVASETLARLHHEALMTRPGGCISLPDQYRPKIQRPRTRLRSLRLDTTSPGSARQR